MRIAGDRMNREVRAPGNFSRMGRSSANNYYILFRGSAIFYGIRVAIAPKAYLLQSLRFQTALSLRVRSPPAPDVGGVEARGESKDATLCEVTLSCPMAAMR